MLSLAMESLHFGSHISNLENGKDALDVIKEELKGLKKDKNINHHRWSKEIEEMLTDYNSFVQDTTKGKWGKQRSIG